MRGSHSCLGSPGVTVYQSLIQPRDCGDNRLRLIEDDHVSSRGDADAFGTDDASAERLAMGRRDHAIALAPNDHGRRPDAIETVDKAELRDRKQQFARHRQLAGIADDERLKELRIIEIGASGHHPLTEFRVVEQQGRNLMWQFREHVGQREVVEP
jgi:hypothetical protein